MIKLYQSQLLSGFEQIKHFFSTRIGGKSTGRFAQANMSLKSGDPHALENRLMLARQLEVDLNRFVFLKQTHSSNIHLATGSDAGRGAFDYQTAIDNVDALVTDRSGLMLIVTTADCVPILVFDSQKKIIAAIHSGWRGTVKKILFKTLNFMAKTFGSQPSDVYLAIGPSIGVCCYEVGQDVEQQVIAAYGDSKFLDYRDGKIFFDLWQANKAQAVDFGVPPSNIDVLRLCTLCNNDQFYSARGGDQGRQISGIMLLPQK